MDYRAGELGRDNAIMIFGNSIDGEQITSGSRIRTPRDRRARNRGGLPKMH
jgi:hypothetical protein